MENKEKKKDERLVPPPKKNPIFTEEVKLGGLGELLTGAGRALIRIGESLKRRHNVSS